MCKFFIECTSKNLLIKSLLFLSISTQAMKQIIYIINIIYNCSSPDDYIGLFIGLIMLSI